MAHYNDENNRTQTNFYSFKWTFYLWDIRFHILYIFGILYLDFNQFTYNRVPNDRIISYKWRQWTIICETQIEQIFTDASLDMFNIWVSNERQHIENGCHASIIYKLLLYIKMNRYCTHTKRILKSHLRPLLNMFCHGRLIIHQSV